MDYNTFKATSFFHFLFSLVDRLRFLRNDVFHKRKNFSFSNVAFFFLFFRLLSIFFFRANNFDRDDEKKITILIITIKKKKCSQFWSWWSKKNEHKLRQISFPLTKHNQHKCVLCYFSQLFMSYVSSKLVDSNVWLILLWNNVITLNKTC